MTTAVARDLLLTPLDQFLTDATRFRIMAVLVGLPEQDRMSFTAVRDLLGMTDGNLGMHLHLLVEVGYTDVIKERRRRRLHSLYQATYQGRAAFTAHVTALESIIAGSRNS